MTGKKVRFGEKLLVVLLFVFLYAPILVLIVFSFNATKSRAVWTGFTFKWYGELFSDATLMSSLYTTLGVAVLSSLIATVAGTLAAMAFYNMKKRWRTPLLTISNIPVVNADIITGVSLSLLFVSVGKFLGHEYGFLGFGTLLLAHISFNIPYVVLSVMPKFRQLDNNLVDAAEDLGCTPAQAFTKVVLPQIMPGVVSGMLIAFTMSVDDFVISYFTAGTTTQTLSMYIYAMTRMRVSPKINAISTLLFTVVLALLIIINFRNNKNDGAAKPVTAKEIKQ